MSYTNADGMYVLTFGDKGAVQDTGTATVGGRQTLVKTITLASLATTFAAVNIDPMDAVIPAGAVILGATLVVTDAATSGGAATVTIGTYNAAGTAIDADGIDATVAITAIDADNDVVRCDGAQATGVGGKLAVDAYIGALYASAAFTAGTAKLVVEYIKVE
jgi:hypothetical protein